jgi:hypothetical protein
MIASRDYRLTNEIMNLYKQIIWEAFTLLHWYILPTTIYKNVFVFISVNHVKENDDVLNIDFSFKNHIFTLLP